MTSKRKLGITTSFRTEFN